MLLAPYDGEFWINHLIRKACLSLLQYLLVWSTIKFDHLNSG
jgi:hypothetical protein